MLVAYPKFHIKPGYLNQYRDAAKDLVVGSLAETGVISYGVFEDISDPGVFVHVEVYKSQQAFDDHVAAPHVTQFLDVLNAVRHPDPEIHLFHVSHSEVVEID